MIKDTVIYILTAAKMIQPIFVSMGASEMVARFISSFMVIGLVFLFAWMIKRRGAEYVYRASYCIGRMPIALSWAWKESKGHFEALKK